MTSLDISLIRNDNGNLLYPHYARVVEEPQQPKCYPLSELTRLQEKGIPTLVYQGFVYTAEGNEHYPFVGLKKVLPMRAYRDVLSDIHYGFAPRCFYRYSNSQLFTNLAKELYPNRFM